MPDHLTRAEAHCYDTLVELTQRLGRGPSHAEMALELGLSKSGAEKHLHALKRKGAISGPKIVGEWKPTRLGPRLRSALP